MKRFITYCLILISTNLFSQKSDSLNLKPFFGDFVGAISVFNMQTGKSIQYNEEQCKKRFSPCSTFKIPNSLIGFETGIITDTSFVINYDSILHPRDLELMKKEPYKYWFQNLSIKNAFKYSCVWYYQELARRIGKQRMQKFITQIDYGNNSISTDIDKFWLDGSMEISINEQIEFLKKLYSYKLNGFSKKNIDMVKSMMLYQNTPSYRLYGKTGAGDLPDNKAIGWYVGFVETQSGVYLFAMNILVNNFDDFKNNLRIEITKNTLKELKIIN